MAKLKEGWGGRRRGGEGVGIGGVERGWGG